MIKLFVEKDYEAISDRAFEVFKETLSQGEVTFGLATGSSPVGLYARLVQAFKNGELSFKLVTTFNLDEYVDLPADHPESYRSFMFNHLFDHVDCPIENIHIPVGTGDVEAEVRHYAELLKNHPQDLQVLGIGSNGHIGFNEPGCDFDSVVHIETLKEQTIVDNARFFDNDVNQVPKQAVTMGIQDIMRAKKILLIASGAKKAKAIYDLFHGEISNDIPCTILQRHPDVVVVVDEKAAHLLKHD
jgi:glucosamine-6-phosphate deaminase